MRAIPRLSDGNSGGATVRSVLVRRQARHAIGTFLCAALAGCNPGSTPVRAPAKQPSRTDSGSLPFPPRAAAPLAEQTPAPVAPPPAFAPSAFYAMDSEASGVFPDVAAFCSAALRDTEVSRSRDTPDPSAPRPRRVPRCRRIPVGATFAGNAEFTAVRAVRVVGSDFAYSTLLVKVDRGFVPLPVGWDEEGPNDPGCPSIVRSIGVERVEIERGLLVVVALGVNQTWVEVPEGSAGDTGARTQLFRQVTVVKRSGDTLHTRTFLGWSGPPLGWKRQPHADGKVPWGRLPWRDWHDVHVLADGTLDLW